MFFASQFAAVTDLYVTTPTWILVLVWVALAAIGTRLANTANRFVKAAGSLLWAVALLWLVASASYSLFSILWYGRWPSLDLPFSPIVELRGFLNPYLSDWTDDVLFLTPLVTFAMMGAFQREISRPLRIIMATWFVAVLLYCLYYIFVTVFYNPPSTIVIAILFFSQTLFGFASSTGSRYSTAQLIRGLQLRSVNVAASGERWQIVLLTIVVAFWYKYQISKDFSGGALCRPFLWTSHDHRLRCFDFHVYFRTYSNIADARSHSSRYKIHIPRCRFGLRIRGHWTSFLFWEGR